MSSIIAGSCVICQLRSELRWDCRILVEDGVAAIAVVHGERLRSEVFGNPMRISSLSVIG